jgi:DNA-binding GntR family transcriptional regulator
MASKKETIIETLKEEILTLQLKPGTLLSETTLSERFSLSRTPIRDILKQLSLAGYIDIYPQRGSVVSYIDLDSVEQIIYMRSIVEKEILKDLCGKLSLQGEHRLIQILNRQAECADPTIDLQSFIKYDDQFHKTLYQLAGREMVWDLIQSSTVHYTRFRHLHMLRKEKLLSIIDEHKKIVEHIKGNEPDAIDSIIYNHLRSDVKSHYFQEHFSAYIKS